MSTPSLKGHCRIEPVFLDRDYWDFQVPCLHCGDMARITWVRIRWREGQRDAAYLVCDVCGDVHHEHENRACRPPVSGDLARRATAAP